MAGDTVSKSEWKKRRAQLDKDLSDDEKWFQSDKSREQPDVGIKHLRKYETDQTYKKTWSKELGYANPKGQQRAKKKIESAGKGKPVKGPAKGRASGVKKYAVKK